MVEVREEKSRRFAIKSFHLQPRDESILALIDEYGFLRITHIYQSLEAETPSLQRSIRKRMTLLYQNGYLEKPSGQMKRITRDNHHPEPGPIHSIYALGDNGQKIVSQSRYLKNRLDLDYVKNLNWEQLRRYIAFSDFLFCLKQTETKDIPLNHSRLKFYESDGRTCRIPFLNFSLDREKFKVFFDFGTTPITRLNPAQESFEKKIDRYKNKLGKVYEKLIFVVDDPVDLKRISKMISSTEKLCEEEVSKNFLFIDAKSLKPTSLLDIPFTDGTNAHFTLKLKNK